LLDNSDLGTALATAEFLLLIAFAGYAAYFALSVRRALVARIYRNAALGISVAALAIATFGLTNYLGYVDPSLVYPSFGPYLFQLLFVALFYTIDSTASTGRFSDPMLRDTLRWRQTRKVLWALIFFGIGYTVFSAYVLNQSETPAFILPIFIPIFTGAILFPLLAVRMGDTTLRRHLLWSGGFFASIVAVSFLGFGSPPLWVFLITDGAFVVAGFCLYRSSKSLVPLNRISSARDS